jgi:predicted thioesterase
MELTAGLEGEKDVVVSPRHLSSATGNFGADVMSTHEMILLMELAAREAVRGRLPEGMITVGTRVDVRHVAAALLGDRVRARARLEAVDGSRLRFRVEATDPHGLLAEGENEQRIVSREAFLERVHRRSGFGGENVRPSG